MDKVRAIKIMTNAAKLYKMHLEDKKVLFLYATPSNINKQLQIKNKILDAMQGYEVAFHRGNFLHLTGVKRNTAQIHSSIHFYETCLNNRLSENDFSFSEDGSTVQKLDILENMMGIKQCATMIGDFADKGPLLVSEKVAGNIRGCIGFVKDRYTKLNVPNTLLQKDIRDITMKPLQKIYAILSKGYTEEKYSKLEKIDKSIQIASCRFSEEIENIINRECLAII